MNLDLLILITITVILLVFFYFINKKLSNLNNQKTDESLVEWLKSMQVTLDSTNKTLNDSLRANSSDVTKVLQEQSKQLNERLDRAAVVIKEVGKEVGQMSEIGRSMKELQDFLKSPKLRGNIGEQVLKDLIAQMFPHNSFFLQYEFKSGEKVDAAIQTDAGILAIDSKFPMENFQKMVKANDEKELYRKEFKRDIKKHIDAISRKYILPEEGTMDFALMYVPSETVFYELIDMADIIDYARVKRVYLVSPNTLYTHLQTILLSFEGKKIEARSKEVFKMLRALQIDYEKVTENMAVMGKHLSNTQAQFTNVQSGFFQFGQKLQTTKLLEEKIVEDK